MTALSLHAQNEYDIWHFGRGKGLDFRSGTATLIDTTPCSTLEGSAVMCDRSTGKILFGAAGGRIYDRNGTTMRNGDSILDGGYTSTQGDLIVPDPCDSRRYYVFTVDQSGYDGAHKGLHYSIVDMRGDGGLGTVLLRNRKLATSASEHMTAVMHANGRDCWVITHSLGGRTFRAYLVNGSGVQPLPVESVVGSDHGNPLSSGFWPLGYLKSSPDGRRLALASMYIGLLELYDFDPFTGIVSRPIRLHGTQLSTYDPDGLIYGLSFSPDGKLLYAGLNGMDYRNYRLMQWSLEPDDPAAIVMSGELVADNSISPKRALLAMQMGPDEKIYAMMSDGWLGVIERPNERGIWCGFRERLFRCFTPPGDPSLGVLGLPNNIDDRHLAGRPLPGAPVRILAVRQRDSCYGADIEAAGGFVRYIWSTGDSGRIVRAPASGRYVLTAVDSSGCPSYDSIDVVTSEGVDVSIDSVGSVTICDGDSIVLSARTSGNVQRFSWSTGETERSIVVRRSGLYIAEAEGDQGCFDADTVSVTVTPIPIVRAHFDRTVSGIVGDTVTLPLHLDQISSIVINREILLSISYDTSLMRPVPPEFTDESSRMTSGTLTAGWTVSTLAHTPGLLRLRVAATPTSPRVTSTGLLLLLRSSTFISAGDSSSPKMNGELPIAIEIPGIRCLDAAGEAGRIHLTLCGGIHRLMEYPAEEFALENPRPNPFNPSTEIRFSLGLDGPTRLDILDVRGRVVATLADEWMEAGSYVAVWNAWSVPSGIYYCRISAGDWMRLKTVVLAR